MPASYSGHAGGVYISNQGCGVIEKGGVKSILSTCVLKIVFYIKKGNTCIY